MSITYDEFLKQLRRTHTKEEVDRIELAIDGIFWRESDAVISRYTLFPQKAIAWIRKQVCSDNPGKDYFTI